MTSAATAPVTAVRLLTVDDLATRWRVPKSQVYRLWREGKLPCVALGRYRRASLDAVLASETSGGTEQEGQVDA